MNVTLVCSHRFDCEFVISEVNANIQAAAMERDDENPTPPVGDVDIMIVPERDMPYGQELKAKLVFTSKAASTRNVDYVIRLSPVTYVDALGRAMARTSDTKILRAGGVCVRVRGGVKELYNGVIA